MRRVIACVVYASRLTHVGTDASRLQLLNVLREHEALEAVGAIEHRVGGYVIARCALCHDEDASSVEAISGQARHCTNECGYTADESVRHDEDVVLAFV